MKFRGRFLPALLILVSISQELSWAQTKIPYCLRPQAAIDRMAEESITYFAQELIKYAECDAKGEDYPVKPVWHSNPAMLGKKNARGDTITLTPQVGLKVVEIVYWTKCPRNRIFKEAVRNEARINAASKEWLFIKRLYLLTTLEEFRTLEKEFIAFSDEERRNILRALEQYQKAGIPIWIWAEHCGNMKDEIRSTAFRLGAGPFACTRYAAAICHLKRGNLRLAHELCAIAVDKTAPYDPSIPGEVAERLVELAINEPAFAQAAREVAHGLKDKGVWELFWREMDSRGAIVGINFPASSEDAIKAIESSILRPQAAGEEKCRDKISLQFLLLCDIFITEDER